MGADHRFRATSRFETHGEATTAVNRVARDATAVVLGDLLDKR